MARIFLSHSSANNSEAAVLRDWLIADGWDDLFLDLDPTRGIAAGERWELALNEAANRCEAVLFLVSRAWLSSRWCLKELSLATRLNKRIFGLLIEDIPIAELPAELTATHQLVNLAAGSDHRMLSGRAADGTEVRVTFSESGLAKLKTGLRRAGLDARFFAWPPENDPERSPYRGLKPLEAEDAGIFFGREAPVVEVLDRLRGLADAAPPRLLAILGASGAGKSSFLRAGLVPRLMRDDRNFLMLPIVRPERAALHGEAALVRSLETAARTLRLDRSRAEIKAAVADGATALATLLGEMAARTTAPALDGEEPGRPPRIVLAVDQGEELFLSEGHDEAEAFLRLVRDLATARDSKLIVLFTIRSDSFERLQTAPELDGLALQTFSLPPMPRGAYQTVIEGPAKRLADSDRVLTIEPGLTAALLADIEQGGGKDALPLLAFTLQRLYEEYGTGGRATLTLAHYGELDGIRGSIEAAVRGALKQADDDPAVPRDEAARLALLRRALIPWVAGIDPETGAPRRRVARLSEIPEEARPLVEHLIAARLLATDIAGDTGERTVEPAHEALLRQWGVLQHWLEEDFAALSALEGIRRAARDWAANDRKDDWLAHTAGRLEDAEAVARREDFAGLLETTDRDYLAAAHAAETARRNAELEEAKKLAAAQKEAAERQRQVARRTRMGLIAASVLLLVAAGAAVFGFDRAREAGQQTAIAERETKKAELKTVEAETQRAMAEAQRKEAEAQRQIAEEQRRTAEEKTAEAVAASKRTEESLATAKESLALASEATLYLIGDSKLADGDLDGALAAYETSVALARREAADPKDETGPRDLMIGLRKIGAVKLRKGETAAALAAYAESVDLAQKLASGTARLRPYEDLINGLSEFAAAKIQTGDAAGGGDAYQQALLLARVFAKRAETAEERGRMRQKLSGIAEGLSRVGDTAGLMLALGGIVDIDRKVVEGGGDAATQITLLRSLDKLAVAASEAGLDERALAADEECLALARDMARKDDSRSARGNLALALEKLAMTRGDVGDAKGALAAYDESLPIRRGLAADKSDAEAQFRLVVTLYEVALAGKDSAQLYREALDILHALDAQEKLTAGRKDWIGRLEEKLADLAQADPATETTAD